MVKKENIIILIDKVKVFNKIQGTFIIKIIIILEIKEDILKLINCIYKKSSDNITLNSERLNSL